jgi:hypothetical protein
MNNMNKNVVESKNYELVTDVTSKLNNLKKYEVGYSNPRNGKMIINFNNQNYLVTVEPIITQGEQTLENAMREYSYIFK